MGIGLNAQFASGNAATAFSAQILEPLIFASGVGELTPGLATDWELSDDALTLTLNLREGVTWHDGEPFTAEDVKFNFEEIVPLAIMGAEITKRLTTVEIIDDHTVAMKLSDPLGPILEVISEQYMLPKHLYEGTDFVTNEANYAGIIGTGPMKFGEYNPGVEIVLVKNPDYWDGESQVDRAYFVQMADENTRQEALFAGELDETLVAASALERIRDSEQTDFRRTGYFPGIMPVFFNTRSEYLSDPAVRRAIFASFDRDAMVDKAMYGIGGQTATGFMPDAWDWAASEEVDFAEDFPRDLDAINAALDEAGFPVGADGKRFTLRIRYIQSVDDLAATVDIMQSQLAEVGIGVELLGTTSQVYLEGVYDTFDYDIGVTTQRLGPEPSVGMMRWFTCNPDDRTNANSTGVCDSEIDEAAALALSTTDRDERAEHYKRLQERAAELMYYAPLFWNLNADPSINTTNWTDAEPKEFRERLSWTTMQPVD
ncbi:ABC transporter substrate-binding protein [Microbacterium faecale]|nr:ABC transporter substrate-binding protein [Microbacterium faecale]